MNPVNVEPVRIHELNHIALHVKDVEESCAFYRNVLRLEPLPRPAFDFPGAWFRLGSTQELHLIGGRQDPVFAHNRGNHFALRVDDLEAWASAIAAMGITPAGRRRRPDGANQLFVRDPDGHMVELFTFPAEIQSVS